MAARQFTAELQRVIALDTTEGVVELIVFTHDDRQILRGIADSLVSAEGDQTEAADTGVLRINAGNADLIVNVATVIRLERIDAEARETRPEFVHLVGRKRAGITGYNLLRGKCGIAGARGSAERPDGGQRQTAWDVLIAAVVRVAEKGLIAAAEAVIELDIESVAIKGL